jgi:hypothetical protein
MSKLAEVSVEDYLVDAVEKKIGGMAIKGAVPGRRFLDRILILPKGVTIWCEVKRPGTSSQRAGQLTEHQGATLRRLDNIGHITWKLKDKHEVDGLLKVFHCYEYASPAALRSVVASFCSSSSLRFSSTTSRGTRPRRLSSAE